MRACVRCRSRWPSSSSRHAPQQAAEEAVRPRIVIRPKAVDDAGFIVKVEGGSDGPVYRILGAKPERWVAQTDFANDEAVGFLADRLAKLGVEDQLFKAGAVAGSTVVIGRDNGVVFDWEPTLTSTAELITSPRGTDVRVDANSRPTRNQRREDYFERMDAKAEARAELVRETRGRPLAGRRLRRRRPGRAATGRMTIDDRSQVPSARRIVVKVGSSSISGENAGQIAPLVDALAEAHGRGTQVILVSSGAIATGIPYLSLDARPTDLATQQAAAAVGQNVLIYRYQDSLDRYDIVAGQVLLTAGDMENPTHRSNAKRAMERLLDLRILPIVNENDTVATHEIRFGDNDRLAALVALLVEADLLVLLSDVDALYTKPPQEPGARAHRVSSPTTTSWRASRSVRPGSRASAPGER